MTYNDLFKQLSLLTDEQRMQTATIYSCIEDEYYAINNVNVSDTSIDVLDPGHIYLSYT